MEDKKKYNETTGELISWIIDDKKYPIEDKIAILEMLANNLYYNWRNLEYLEALSAAKELKKKL